MPDEELVEPLAEVKGIATFEDLNPDPHITEINLFAHYTEVELEPGEKTAVMAYNGVAPGPLLQARVGDTVVVHLYNQLSEPTTVHWHGLRISDQMDGNPRIMSPVEPGESFTYEFVLPDAGTYWYHPHVSTIEQVERGLYGAIVVSEEDAPEFNSERIVVLDDVRLTNDFQIASFSQAGHDIVHGRAGNALLTNGSTQPLKDSVGRGAVERWRLVNTSQARHMSLSIEGAAWRVIATDGGLLPQPYTRERLDITVGQRFDLEVTFDGEPGSTVEVIQHVLAVVDDEVQEVPFVVGEYTIDGDEPEPATPNYPQITLPEIPTQAEEIVSLLGGYNDPEKGVVFTINGESGMDIEDVVVPQGVPHFLRVKNDIGPFHPFHLHGQFFQILTRDGVDALEPGLKDSVFIGAFEEVTLLTHFDNPGEWMYHCHIPAHAENGMMSQMIVTPAE